METEMHIGRRHLDTERVQTDRDQSTDVPEEILIQSEVAERLTEMKGSANRYAWIIADWLAEGKEPDAEFLAEMLLNEKHELPLLVSAVLERTCNLQCTHCLYQDEKSSAKISEQNHLDDVIAHIVSQMPERESEEEYPTFMSAGRILRPSHLALFTRLQAMRPDVTLNVIDNGTYTQLLPKWPEGFKFDVMDISIDGTEEHHNTQRQSPKAYAQAMEGLEHAHEVAKRVTSLLTLTNINARDIEAVADALLTENNGKPPLIDQLNMTTMSPTNAANAPLEITPEEFKIAWEGIKHVSQKYTETETDPDGIVTTRSKVKLNIYRVADIEKLAMAVGEKQFLECFTEKKEGGLGTNVPMKGGRNFLTITLDGVEVSYQPLSIWTPEEFLIEADGAYRTAYEGQFTLAELRAGKSRDGRDTTGFTIEQLTPESDFRATYEKGVDKYWVKFGKQRLSEEMEAFKRIKERAALQR